MNFLLKAATVIDPESNFHYQTVDILIENGVITEISSLIKNNNDIEEISFENLHVSQGWFDSSVSFGEPGYEERETIAHGLEVAAKSGFTAVALNPATSPIIDTSASVGFLTSKAQNHAVSLYPVGSLTVGSKGIDLAELYDMRQAGAIAFGDYKKAIQNPNLLKIALQYAQNFDGLVFSFPQENDIAGKGMVNEEEQSTILGLKGIPALAEELQVARDLFLLEYTGGKLHIPTISTAKSVTLVKEAKEKGLQVSCSVSIHHLTLTDIELKEFNTNFKVLPPLRTQKDLDALLEGVKDGTIDMVTSDHQPMDVEHKKVEFDNAKYGTIGLDSAFGILNYKIGTKKTIEMFTKGKSTFGIQSNSINIGNQADLSLFSPEENATFTEEDILSTSKNSAFIGQPILGTPYGVISNKKIVLK
ncbi:dihydroorotase [Aquimarina sp. 2201CG5-10]|uniref:dihydroorotase n=1 Tax=Aquimarina callyspongiae TaxID=3098150 RepID=UPI002AB422D2|nr:dihydroorotase [Aquimarina sp. 2201CG5-10]MDY8135579.1 dihydroorotase [Aquimarina sp. 2201CG5-10]